MRPNPAAELLTGAQLGPRHPPGPHVLCFHRVHRPGWAPAKPSLAGEGQAGAVPGSAEALAKNSRAVLRKAGGLSCRPAGTQVSASCPGLEMRGRMTSQLPPSQGHGDRIPPRPACSGTTFKEEPRPDVSCPSAPNRLGSHNLEPLSSSPG